MLKHGILQYMVKWSFDKVLGWFLPFVNVKCMPPTGKKIIKLVFSFLFFHISFSFFTPFSLSPFLPSVFLQVFYFSFMSRGVGGSKIIIPCTISTLVYHHRLSHLHSQSPWDGIHNRLLRHLWSCPYGWMLYVNAWIAIITPSS